MMEFTEEFLKARVKEGFERNILVYDSDAESGVLTTRLLALMATVMYRNKGVYREPDDLKYIFVTGDAKIQLDGVVTLNRELYIGDKFDFTDYLLELKGSLVHDDVKMVLGIGKNGEVLLGSF